MDVAVCKTGNDRLGHGIFGDLYAFIMVLSSASTAITITLFLSDMNFALFMMYEGHTSEVNNFPLQIK